MRYLFNVALIAASLLAATAAQAAAYKCQDDAGRTVYSDIPCAKKAPPPPKAEPAKAAAKADAAAVMTKITEADVLRVLGLAEDYTRRNSHVEFCDMLSDDLKFTQQFQTVKPPKTISGGKAEMCLQARQSAELSKRTGMISQSDRGPTKVVIEAGETRATATYESAVKFTRYDRIIDSMHCSSKDQFVLSGGKLLLFNTDNVCKP